MNDIKPYERKVFYYETDKMGIMHHSNYIRIFEESRVHFMQEAGMPFENIEALGLMMPVLSVDCKYKKPLLFDEEFSVYSVITKFNGVSLHISYRIVKKKTSEICAEGESVHCFTDNDMKPIRIKHKYPDIYNLFVQHINTILT